MSERRTILSRPRTRIYDSNYNIGESYYKSALNRLDRKYSGRPLASPPRHSSPLTEIAERHARVFADEDLNTSRRRAEKHITEQNLFDSRGGRIGSRALDAYSNGIDEETASTLQRIRANKKVSIIDDVDLETTSNNLKTHRHLDRSEKILDSVGINDNRRDEDVSYRRRALKMSYDADGDDLTKWTPLEDKPTARARRAEALENSSSSIRASRRSGAFEDSSESSSAAIRARQSKAKIDDIEEEMAALAEKQAARERRVARLKALVAECEDETVSDAGVAMESMSVSTRKEKKSVRF